MRSDSYKVQGKVTLGIEIALKHRAKLGIKGRI